MAMYKLCSRCGKKIEYNSECEECNKEREQEQKEYNSEYDKNVRNSKENKKYTDFYHSRAWNNLTEIVKRDRCGIDIYAYYTDEKIEEATITHHLRKIKVDGWEDRLNKSNLVGLSHASHTKIHNLYKSDYEGTIAMLERLMERWNKEFG